MAATETLSKNKKNYMIFYKALNNLILLSGIFLQQNYAAPLNIAEAALQPQFSCSRDLDKKPAK